jgi:hypothetical protein
MDFGSLTPRVLVSSDLGALSKDAEKYPVVQVHAEQLGRRDVPLQVPGTAFRSPHRENSVADTGEPVG